MDFDKRRSNLGMVGQQAILTSISRLRYRDDSSTDTKNDPEDTT